MYFCVSVLLWATTLSSVFLINFSPSAFNLKHGCLSVDSQALLFVCVSYVLSSYFSLHLFAWRSSKHLPFCASFNGCNASTFGLSTRFSEAFNSFKINTSLCVKLRTILLFSKACLRVSGGKNRMEKGRKKEVGRTRKFGRRWLAVTKRVNLRRCHWSKTGWRERLESSWIFNANKFISETLHDCTIIF